MRGKVDAVARGRILGWLWDEAKPADPVAFALDVNGSVKGPFVADIFRKDLLKHGIGAGAHAFEIPIEEGWLVPGPNEIQLLVDGQPLKTPFVVQHALEPTTITRQPPSPPRTIRGRLERVSQGMLLGWVWDTRNDEPVEFTLLVNEKPVGNFLASESRADLVREGIGSGAHAFRIPLNRDWLNTGENIFSLRTAADQQRLPDALVVQRAERTVPKPPPHQGKSTKRTQPEVLKELSGWSTQELSNFYSGLESEVLLHRARALVKGRKWEELSLLLPVTRVDRRGRADLEVLIGRGLLQSREHGKAAVVLTHAAEQNPENVNAQFYASVACSRSGRLEEAVTYGRTALKLSPDNQQYLIDHGVACRRYATRIEADVNLRRSVLLEAVDTLARALKIAPDRSEACLIPMARSQSELDLHAEALGSLDQLLDRQPDHVDALLLKSQALVALNRVGEALRIAERVIELDPMRQGPRFLLRSLRTLAGDEDGRPVTFAFARWDNARRVVEVATLEVDSGAPSVCTPTVLEFDANPAMALGTLSADWLLFSDERTTAVPDVDALRRLRSAATDWAGCLRVGTDGLVAWRRELLIGLTEAGVIHQMEAVPGALSQHADLIQTSGYGNGWGQRQDLMAESRNLTAGPVVVMSRHGIVKFGGGEQFLDSMAEHYEQMGLEPVVVGTRPERVGEEGMEGGRRYAFVDMAPAALRSFFLRIRPRFVHVLSGLGYQTAEALEYLNIPFVYGVHFWRDALGKSGNDNHFFTDHDKGPIPKPSFNYIIQKAATVYANSQYTQAVLEEAFHFRAPVIYSVPRETSTDVDTVVDHEQVLGIRDFVLLVNARSDKGLDLLIEVAKRMPSTPFVAIASQSDRREAEFAVAAAGLTNFHIIDHTRDMDQLYLLAKVAAVPSYRFVETFSRVCIEAQRFGTPVLGSTIGNVPYLLENSGVVLPEDPEAWLAELSRIYTDDAYCGDLRRRAMQNSQRFSYEMQSQAVSGMISTIAAPVLIGVGSGIGNMLHVTPMIRNVVRRTGRKVDLVVTEDHENSLFLLRNDEFVNSVYSVRQGVLRRYYDTVLITHSFGDARLPFQAKHLLFARDWRNFEPAGPLHEAVYNLEAAKQLLGVPYDEEDAHGYYLGNSSYTPPPLENGVKIGFHGGSKDGFWRSKRWPGHAELARRLAARGYHVSSFGVPEEYVPGTVDLTGGTIAEMISQMLGLHYLVSNDSGLMNIANALGIPVTAMFAPTNPLTRAPIRPNGHWIAVDKICSPCEITREGAATFKSGLCQCINEIPLARVEEAVLTHLWEAYPELMPNTQAGNYTRST